MKALIGSAIALLILLAIGRLSGPYRRTRWRTDVGWWFVNTLLAKPVIGVAMFLSGASLLSVLGRPLTRESLDGWGLVGELPQGLQFLLALFIVDLAGYAMHRLHHEAGLWRFHAIHHSAEELDWLASIRGHPINAIVQRVPGVMLLLMLGFNVTALAAPGLIGLYGLLLHSHFNWRFGPLGHVFVTPAFHRWHHSRDRDCNFGALLVVWDKLFGTFHLPGEAPETFGVRGDAPPEGVVAQLVWPLRGRSL